MTQLDLHRAISKTTGDCVRVIKQRGFSLVTPFSHDTEGPEAAPQVVDWDRLESERIAYAVQA